MLQKPEEIRQSTKGILISSKRILEKSRFWTITACDKVSHASFARGSKWVIQSIGAAYGYHAILLDNDGSGE